MMTYKELMIEALTDLLKDDETLMHPIYGLLNQGNTQCYGYFGFTEHYLLIALLSGTGKQITYTTRVPLDIKSIKVRKTAIFKQYVIDIFFNEGAPCRITASPKVLTVDTQKENLPSFLEHLYTIAPKTKQPELKQLFGEKIRTQYFNYILGVFLSFVPVIPIVILILEWKESGEWLLGELISAFIKVLPITGLIWGVVLIPLILLSILNRFCFGKVICVLDDKGIHTENELLLWTNIKSVSFKIAMHSRFRYRPACTTFSIKNAGEYEIDIMHFPFYGLRKIKRYCPNVKVKVHNKGWIMFLALCPTIIAIVLSLLS